MRQLTCGFIGLGLIGGSIARALRENVFGIKIIAYDTDSDTLELAEKDGTADITADTIDMRFSVCDYIFLCAPVRHNDSNLEIVRKIMKPGCLLTDVGSVKGGIHESVRRAGLEECFIGGHPMAGSERVGYANSKAALLENAYYILTPTPLVSEESLGEFRELIESVKAIPLVMTPEKHDYVTAAISHLPHVVASALVNLIRDSDSADGVMRLTAAGGFKDITRIASSQAAMWQQICLSNKDNICLLLDNYINALLLFKKEIDAADADSLYRQFEGARIYRDSFINASSGPIKRCHNVSVEIADKSGSLAQITALLAEQGLNIKNIGITHNRESEDGVLKIEFYDETSMTAAETLLRGAGFSVSIRI